MPERCSAPRSARRRQCPPVPAASLQPVRPSPNARVCEMSLPIDSPDRQISGWNPTCASAAGPQTTKKASLCAGMGWGRGSGRPMLNRCSGSRPRVRPAAGRLLRPALAPPEDLEACRRGDGADQAPARSRVLTHLAALKTPASISRYGVAQPTSPTSSGKVMSGIGWSQSCVTSSTAAPGCATISS